MFYSQTFLARKGPLGTVWCAAHLQSRLRKSHYTSTDIVSTVDRIMYPEVPIALRMSGHLLLGVVRIYSKKVEYFFHDVNVMLVGLRKAFSSVNVNLPASATTANPESVTLPQVLDLDALNVGVDELLIERSLDTHLRSQEDITLMDQVPVAGRDQYIAITFDEDILMHDAPTQEEDGNGGVRPMDEDVLPRASMDGDVVLKDIGSSEGAEPMNDADGSRDPGTSNETEVILEPLILPDSGTIDPTEVFAKAQEVQDSSPRDRTQPIDSRPPGDDSPPEIEVMRDATHDFNLPPLSPENRRVASELDIGSGNHVLNDEGILTPIMEDILPSRGNSFQSHQHREVPNSAASHEVHGVLDTNISFGDITPDLAICSSPLVPDLAIRSSPAIHPSPPVQERATPPPPPPAQPPRRRSTKRKQFFDESPVLKNKFMKKALEDTSDTLRKRRLIPSSPLELWKLNNKLRKEYVFNEPLLTGLSGDICSLSKDYMSTKPHLALDQEVFLDANVATENPANEGIPEPGSASAPPPIPEEMAETRDSTSPVTATEVHMDPTIEQTSPVTATEVHMDPTVEQFPTVDPEFDREIEHFRHVESHVGLDIHDVLPSPRIASPERFMSSSLRTDDFTPAVTDVLGSETVNYTKSSTGIGVLPTPEIAPSTASYGSSVIFSDEGSGADHGLSAIPELMTSADAGDLYFLEADNTPPGSQGSQGVDALSVRTRAVAQYLQRHSPSASMAEDSSEGLSLNHILQGRRRKLCARMFYETLVLKSHGLIDVQQEQPYGDITLKLTPSILKTQI